MSTGHNGKIPAIRPTGVNNGMRFIASANNGLKDSILASATEAPMLANSNEVSAYDSPIFADFGQRVLDTSQQNPIVKNTALAEATTLNAIAQQLLASQTIDKELANDDKTTKQEAKTKVTGEDATIEDAKSQLAGLEVNETSGVASLDGGGKASMAAGAALESGEDLNKENVVDSLAKMFGGNQEILDFIKEGVINIADTVGGMTRFGGAAGAMATVGKIALGRGTFGVGMLAHEAAHAFLDPALDGTLDGKTGNEKIDGLLVKAEEKVRASNYNLDGLQSLHYGMAEENPDDAERLAVLFENYVANNEAFKEHFPELAEAFDEHLSKDMDREIFYEDTEGGGSTTQQPMMLAMNPLQLLMLGRQMMGLNPGPIFPQAFPQNNLSIMMS